MVNKIEIKNFKSIVDLKMDLGRFNVIIGANGSGKSNILESFAFASAASQDKLDNEYLSVRGVRIPAPQFLRPAFDDIESPTAVEITITEGNSVRDTKVKYDKENKRWEDVTVSDSDRRMVSLIEESIRAAQKETKVKNLNKEAFAKLIDDSLQRVILDLAKKKVKSPDNQKYFFEALVKKKSLPTFLIFTPDELILRAQNLESPIQPLGVHGEGLFSFLKNRVQEEKDIFEKINEGLSLLDWFDSFNIPSDLLSNEAKLNIGDRYLKESLHYFDQRSTNEGFLYLLFYLTLFNSKDTPSFFAIDNIESSFNPKLCTRLISSLIKSSKENDKQVILTTHSPFVLDGLDLSDDEQRLFVARRDLDGHTRLRRILYKEERTQKLSEIWMNGYIGGLPDNF